MPDGKPLGEIEGDIRFHHVTPELWIMEARRCAHRWVVFHETYSFCLIYRVQEGPVIEWKYNHRLYVADRHHAMAMQPGELHANRTRTQEGDFIVVQVAEPLMKRVARELGWPFADLNVKHPHPGSDHPLLLQALKRFHQALCTSLFDTGPGGGLCTCWRASGQHMDNLAGLVAVFIENCAENSREVVLPRRGAAQIARALAYLRAHYNEPYSLERVARAAGCDSFYLAHLFSKEMGISPSGYQSKILVAKACMALATSPEKPLELIASDVGWPGRSKHSQEDVAEKATLLIRHFRRTLGMTPGEFRASLREMSRLERRRYAAAPRRS